MNVSPLLAASPIVKIHLSAAVGAFVLGVVQCVAPKGTISHRSVGWIWIALMAVMIGAGFAITDTYYWGPFSTNVCRMAPTFQSSLPRCAALHTLSLTALLFLPYGALHARRYNIELHRRTMLTIFLFAVVVAGAFTFQAPRILHSVFFGR